jgi:protein-tyrosine phosphatase
LNDEGDQAAFVVQRSGVSASSAPARVLFVCTGNVCRSPMAERLLIAMVDASVERASVSVEAARRDVIVESAGVAALAGQGMDAASAEAIRELGADPDGHVARQLTDEMLDRAHLVLVA